MNVKWYISSLFLILIYFGGFYEHVSIPNQEIVLEFVDAKINQKNIKNTITDVQEKLLKIGVSNIKIQKTENGTLKISYYSDVPVHKIKDALSKEHQLVLNKQSKNNQQNHSYSDYNINIYQLTNEVDISNLDDQFIFEIKPSTDRSTSNYKYALVRNFKIHKANQLFKTAFNAAKKSPFTKDRTSNKEPEVRAGPHVYYI
ncbi:MULTISPECIES: hypothetical protein [unclassified Polaribacter]|uniref:hypothetical protein n=1 Tax=unclassified Polaribacter TaxID=196858 RepID=UPI0011BF4E8F|nr:MULTISPECIES: hypothetical protein [unclassified Polaribacter]TXD53299.1 hypothetical protein ES043_04615 [Polaribacter sp. IC063]TXD60248.1 hypothetical protein ES044_08040 [Polaribacter sp. IC066]